ncbi:helix-turn-helix transcriptional regulator [Cryptosporangium japonicum]|uniref:helix-turn-helix transcriptional regulator n=1 Tax=Cryptosporangium japonicum TaxID=80872 RepID=UPI0031DDEFA9
MTRQPANGRSGGVVRAESDDGRDGERVRNRRKEQGLTQVDLAQRIGVSRQTVVTMETGDYAPSVYLALRIARTLDTTVEALWG